MRILRGIVYMLTGTRHAIVAAVSVMTLRDWWDGPVSIFFDESSRPLAERILAACDGEPRPYQPVKRRRHSGYYNKTLIPHLSPYTDTVQLDADTLVVGPLDELWPRKPDEWVLTPFAHWRSTGKIVGNRIRNWADAAPKLVADKQRINQPALNTGVQAYGPDCWLAKRVYHEVTALNPEVFISDETAADLIIAQPHWFEYVRMLDERFNWSPLMSEPNDDKRVIHIHGRRHTRDDRAQVVWWPYFMRAYRENYAGVADWWGETRDKYFRRYVKENPECFTC